MKSNNTVYMSSMSLTGLILDNVSSKHHASTVPSLWIQVPVSPRQPGVTLDLSTLKYKNIATLWSTSKGPMVNFRRLTRVRRCHSNVCRCATTKQLCIFFWKISQQQSVHTQVQIHSISVEWVENATFMMKWIYSQKMTNLTLSVKLLLLRFPMSQAKMERKALMIFGRRSRTRTYCPMPTLTWRSRICDNGSQRTTLWGRRKPFSLPTQTTRLLWTYRLKLVSKVPFEPLNNARICDTLPYNTPHVRCSMNRDWFFINIICPCYNTNHIPDYYGVCCCWSVQLSCISSL